MFKELALLILAFAGQTFAQQNVTCVQSAYPPPAENKVPWFTINLDLPPEERWKEVAMNRKDQIRNLLEKFKDFIRDWGSFADKLITFVDDDLGNLDKTLPYPFAGEIQGMSKYSGLNLGEVVLFNIFYEFFTVCTSIVAEDYNGNFVHARNLDFGLFIGWDVKNKTWEVTEALRPLVVNLDFQRGGKTVFKSVNFAGYIGILTALKPSNVTCTQNAYPPSEWDPVPWYTVNLDLPPEERWRQVATGRKPQIRHLLAVFKEFMHDWGDVADKVMTYVDNNMGNLDKTLPYPFAGEIRGISKYSGLNLGEVVLYNLIYEFTAFCTSIVAEDVNGNFVHARNLDFGMFMGWDVKNKTWALTEALRPLVINLDFHRGGKTVFKSVNFAGFVGILTGLKPGIFSFSMNERFGDGGGIIGILKWLEGIRTEQWMGFLTRSVLENATGYLEAQTTLVNTKMLAPAYFILGGNVSGQASVITRAPDFALDVWAMSSIAEHPWYILETNYDHWKNPDFLDNRRDPGIHCMNQMGRENVGFAGIADVLSTQPVLNKQTAYTSLMEVKTGRLETYVRYCKDPCFPW